jgi:hypothetical protein
MILLGRIEGEETRRVVMRPQQIDDPKAQIHMYQGRLNSSIMSWWQQGKILTLDQPFKATKQLSVSTVRMRTTTKRCVGASTNIFDQRADSRKVDLEEMIGDGRTMRIMMRKERICGDRIECSA